MKRPAAVMLLAWPAPALAHAGELHAGWTLDPVVIMPLILAALLYGIGFTRLRPRADRGRAALGRQARIYVAGWLLTAGAIVSPLHEAGERSFTFHMIEHELLMLPAALLLVAARPGPVLLWGLPRTLRKFAGSVARASIEGCPSHVTSWPLATRHSARASIGGTVPPASWDTRSVRRASM